MRWGMALRRRTRWGSTLRRLDKYEKNLCHMRSFVSSRCKRECQGGLLEKWFMAEHLSCIFVRSAQLPSKPDEAVETAAISHHHGSSTFPDHGQAELPLDTFANLDDALTEMEEDDGINSTLHVPRHSQREATRRNIFVPSIAIQSGKTALGGLGGQGENLLFAGIMDLVEGNFIASSALIKQEKMFLPGRRNRIKQMKMRPQYSLL
jgi:hypothetical protein